MRRFDLDLLQTLVTVAQVGSLTEAGVQVGRSQSAISEQVRKLEDFCGVQLVSRSKKGTSLTPAGERLAVHARRLLSMNDTAYQDIRGTILAGDVRLAITDYFRPADVAKSLKRLRVHYPRLRLHVSIRRSALIEQDGRNGDVDIGLSMRILECPRDDDDVWLVEQRTRVRREPLSWVADPAFALGNSDRLPLIILPEHCSLHRFVIKTLDAANIPYVIAHSASGIAGLQLALAAGLGVSCLNLSAIPAGMRRYDGPPSMPILPDVEFCLLPPSPGEPPLLSDVRRILLDELA